MTPSYVSQGILAIITFMSPAAFCCCNFRGPGSAWHLQHVEVINHSTATRAFFYANTWLDAKLGTTSVTLDAAAADAAPLKNKWKVSVQTRSVLHLIIRLG